MQETCCPHLGPDNYTPLREDLNRHKEFDVNELVSEVLRK